MILASIYLNENISACIEINNDLYPIPIINSEYSCTWSENLFDLINNNEIKELENWIKKNKQILIESKSVKLNKSNISFAPLYRNPKKIWGIGLNYADHARDLSEKTPEEIPASFIKPDTTIIGYGEEIKIPKLSTKTTGEAELGVIIGKECKDVEKENWLDYVAGFTTIIDMTAEDILRKNPRYLTLSKSFDTFFSFGPYFYTPEEIRNVESLEVSTVINNEVYAKNTVSNMTFPPDFLVSFHSKVMTLLPGDIISTGTPKATPLKHGDQIECRISGFEPLKNKVIDLKI